MDKQTFGNLHAARERTFIELLNNKIDMIRSKFCDQIHYDQQPYRGGMQTRVIAWRLGQVEFLLNYHEVENDAGSAVFRIRTQPSKFGSMGDAWIDIPSLGELDAALRKAKKDRGYTASDLKAQKGSNKHEGEAPDGLILVGLTGSHAYGLNHEGYWDSVAEKQMPPSDVDTRGVFVLPTREVLKLGQHKELVEQKETDTKYDEVGRFLELCLNPNPERIEMLSTPNKILSSPEGELIVQNRHIFLSRKVIKVYGGYAKSQLYRIERKEDRSTKPRLHLIRLLLTGIGILKEGVVNCDMTAYRDQLMAIRMNVMSLDEVLKWHQQLEVEFAKAIETTKLPEHPDVQKANEILLEIRANHW